MARMTGTEFEEQYSIIKKIEIEAQIEILKTLIEPTNKVGDSREYILNKIKDLEKQL